MIYIQISTKNVRFSNHYQIPSNTTYSDSELSTCEPIIQSYIISWIEKFAINLKFSASTTAQHPSEMAFFWSSSFFPSSSYLSPQIAE